LNFSPYAAKPLTKQKGAQPEKMHEKLVSILVLNGVVGAMQYTAKIAIYRKCRILGINSGCPMSVIV
jgi:tRNA-dihydrouridine synthase